MRFRDVALALGITGASMFVYGMLVESNRLLLERRTLPLADWPETLDGFRIGFLSDLHLRGEWSVRLTQRAVALVMQEEPDVIVIGGDLVDYWKRDSESMLVDSLGPLHPRKDDVLIVPGNHDYYCGDIGRLTRVLEASGLRLLRNEVFVHKGVSWVGIDSALEGDGDPVATMAQLEQGPAIALWHEGDLVDDLPRGCSLMLSGHSHGGQFRIPGVIRPYNRPTLGHRYFEGFYPDTPTPLYVSRGVGTTGPPSRFMCAPEVAILTLVRAKT